MLHNQETESKAERNIQAWGKTQTSRALQSCARKIKKPVSENEKNGAV